MDLRDKGPVDPSDSIVDIREYDVPYHVRVAIDKGMHAMLPVVCTQYSQLTMFRYSNWEMV